MFSFPLDFFISKYIFEQCRVVDKSYSFIYKMDNNTGSTLKVEGDNTLKVSMGPGAQFNNYQWQVHVLACGRS